MTRLERRRPSPSPSLCRVYTPESHPKSLSGRRMMLAISARAHRVPCSGYSVASGQYDILLSCASQRLPLEHGARIMKTAPPASKTATSATTTGLVGFFDTTIVPQSSCVWVSSLHPKQSTARQSNDVSVCPSPLHPSMRIYSFLLLYIISTSLHFYIFSSYCMHPPINRLPTASGQGPTGMLRSI